jgi:hypothetical protein
VGCEGHTVHEDILEHPLNGQIPRAHCALVKEEEWTGAVREGCWDPAVKQSEVYLAR